MHILHLDQNHPLLIEQLSVAGHDNEENYTEDDIPFEPSLILDVEEYKRKIIFK